MDVWVDVTWEGNKVGDSFEVIWVEIVGAEIYFEIQTNSDKIYVLL